MADEMATLLIKSSNERQGGPESQNFTLEACDFTWSIKAPTLSLEDSARLRWYFEDYAEREPFEVSKASDAKDILQTYGSRLAQSLELWHCPASFLNSRLRLYVEADQGSEHGTKTGLWEILESLAFWPSKCRPSVVTVVRRMKKRLQSQDSPKPPIWLPSLCGQVNVLIVYARPQGARDIPHRLVSKAVLEAAAQSRRLVHIDIVRPETFDALVEHLNTKPHACYQLVHFDVHGVEQDNKLVPLILSRSMLSHS